METMIEEKLSIDKTNWTPVKFGDVVFEPKESSKDPHADGIEHVVGLEHIEPENIHLKNSATLEESTTFTKRFAIGDVLFGRRRAYLKKAAQASFNGICSGDITVFRANEKLMSELLPFIVNNEKFFDYAVKHSAGGLSPRVKFKDLANYEFLLPPKDQQAQLAKLLWAMDEVIQRELEILSDLEIYKKTNYKKIYSYHENRIKLGNSSYIDIISSGINKFENTKEYISTKCIKNYKITQIEELIEYNDRPSRANMQPVDNSIWFAKMKDTLKVIKPTQKEIEQNIFSTGFCGLKINSEKVDIDYIFHFLLSDQFNAIKDSRAIGTTQLSVNNQIISTIPVPLPSLYSQKKFSSKLNNILSNIEQLEFKISSSKALQKSLINQIF